MRCKQIANCETEKFRENLQYFVYPSTDSTSKKKSVRTLASYGKKAIPFIQELRSVETDEDMRNNMFDAITQIEKGNL